MASFLKRNPGQVLVVVVEDYVPPSTIERAFGEAGLTRYAETLRAAPEAPDAG